MPEDSPNTAHSPLGSLSSLRQALGDVGALAPRTAIDADARPTRTSIWLRTAQKTIEALETICCTIVLCCSRLGHKDVASKCDTATENSCK